MLVARRLIWIALAALAVAAVTALIFLIRAGGVGETNWPINFELRSSDNGPLFQFAQDVFNGRPLDWSFSPQVFVFPEIPISLLGYLLAGGTVQLYYLMVACINSALVFLCLFAIIRYLFPAEPLGPRVLRASIAMVPLLYLALNGNTWLFEYQLAPTYYFGMYLMILIAPALFLARARWVRIVLAIAIALTAASNPLGLVFTIPAAIVIVIVSWISSGWRSVRAPILWTAASLLLALAIRLLFFGSLQGTSPLSYVSASSFAGRLQNLRSYLQAMLFEWSTGVVLCIGVALLFAGLVVGAVFVVRAIRRRLSVNGYVIIYYALVPITGLVATGVLLITEYLYLWPVIILPLVLALVPLPRRRLVPVAIAGALLLVVVGAASGGIVNLEQSPTYFSYRNPDTQCLDEKLPRGVTIGYSTFSDARRIELTSHRGIRLIQLKSNGMRAYWLTNRDYARDSVGQFFFINYQGDEPPISTSYLEKNFGQPDSTFRCAGGVKVLVYTSPAKLAKIKARYETPPPPGESLAPIRQGSSRVQAVS